MAINTVTIYLSGYDNTDYAYASAKKLDVPIGQPASNNNYAFIGLTTGSSAVTYIYYLFDTSALPDNAEIISMVCKAKASVSTASALYVSQKNMQLFSGDTAKGTAVNLNQVVTEHTIDTGTWTREELNDCRLRLYASRGSLGTSTERTILFAGAELTITYNAPELIPIIGSTTIGAAAKAISSGYVNIGGVRKPVVKSYSNVNGVWLPTFGYRDTVYTWKKYNTAANKQDGWAWSSIEHTVGGTDTATLYAYKTDNSHFWSTPEYGDGTLDALRTGMTGYKVTYEQWKNDLDASGNELSASYCDYVTFINPETDWANGEHTPNPDYIYYMSNTMNKDVDSFGVRPPAYSPTYTYTQGTYIEDVTSTNYTEYPDNGRHTDGYWYVKQS